MKKSQEKAGCWFIQEDLLPEDLQMAVPLDALIKQQDTWYCRRCGVSIRQNWKLPTGYYYCRSCILLGRLTQENHLYYFPPKSFPHSDCLKWGGQLTPYQQDISDKLVKAVEDRQDSLVHAVTGAGKTEMIYQAVATTINQGGQVCLASPRIDVCLELYNRLVRDFSCDVDLLHGQSQPYSGAPLVVATAHQMLKFYKCFDLILVDEVDAFPYVDDPVLYHAVSTAKKDNGVTIFMTATSTKALDKRVRRKELQKLTLSRRFHGNPLIIPKTLWLSSLEKQVHKGRLPKKLELQLIKQLSTDYPLLIFVPEIDFGKTLTNIFHRYFPQVTTKFVASTSLDRVELVQQFREGTTRVLITTTILERGVTFPKVDVFVLLAHHRLFTSSSLIQISGRVGRSMERPTGDLFFFHEGLTKAIKETRREIKKMNQLGGF